MRDRRETATGQVVEVHRGYGNAKSLSGIAGLVADEGAPRVEIRPGFYLREGVEVTITQELALRLTGAGIVDLGWSAMRGTLPSEMGFRKMLSPEVRRAEARARFTAHGPELMSARPTERKE